MRIDHVAIWTRDGATLERLRAFYETWFGATAGPRYESERRAGFASYFLSFGDGARLELMTVPGLAAGALSDAIGLAHIAIAVGARESVDDLVRRMAVAGVPVESAARTTGDGYYEAVVHDPDGNRVEITV